jgi:hypothetical protein
MRTFNSRLLTLAGAAGFALAASATAASADALPTPAMAGPLTANANPFSVDLPDWFGDAGGKIYIGGDISGLAYAQSNATHLVPGDADTNIDLSNGQVWIQKTDGWLQFYAAFGAYSFPTVGVPYLKASATEPATFGYMPVGYLKLQGQGDWSAWSLEGGKLPTLIGAELPFTFQNMNIQRGQLWNIEPLVSRGVQLNFSSGPWNASVSWNDGTYSNVLNTMSGLLSYGFNGGADTVAFAASGNLGNGNFSFLNSGSVYNLIWTHTSGNWTITPYLQYNDTPALFLAKGSTTFGGAILASYAFNDNWKLAGRVEYVSQSGHPGVFTTPDILGFGPGSNAVTVTITPTYQWKWFYARAEASYISLGSASVGFGPGLTATDQFRGVFELGVLF